MKNENFDPVKSKEIFTHHLDSRIWNDFNYREGDIVKKKKYSTQKNNNK